MSGLAGLFRVAGPPDRKPLPRMIRALDARGPDARVEVSVPDGSIAVTLRAPGETGSNPAWDPTGRWCVATDGELLNARQLLYEQRAWGEGPEEDSTAAVVACLFGARGFESGLERLTGDVAILAWDTATRTLHLVRDRAGLRPLHWALLDDGTIVAASEPGALLAHPGVGRAPDPDGLRDALTLGAALPPATPWHAIRKLGPGERLTWSGGAPTVVRWWEESANPPGADGARYRWARSLRFSTELAIQQRVAVDAPIAVALSGGLYAEALLAATAARRRGALLALTLAPDGGDELARARVVAERCNAELVAVPLPTADVPAILAELAALSEPLLAPEALAWWVLARAAADRGAEALFTGIGGASLYGGVPAPVAERAAGVPVLGMVGRRARAGAERLGEPWARRHLRRRLAMDAPPRWAALDALAATAPDADPIGAAAWLDRRIDAEAAHATLDRAAGAHGVRAQSPYADAPLAKLVASFPIGHLAQVRRPRGLFQDGLAERLGGDAPAHRPMTLPVDAWLALPGLTDGVADTLAGLVPPDLLRLSPEVPAARRWALVALAAWRRRHPA